MKNILKGGGKVGMVLLCVAIMSACSTNPNVSQSDAAATTVITTTQSETGTGVQLASVKLTDLVTFDEEDTTTDWSAEESTVITLNGTSAEINGSGAEAKEGSVTITAAGTYILSGTLSDGQIVVDVLEEETVRLVLNGVDFKNSDSAPIYIKEAEKVIITLQGGTENVITDGATYVFADEATDEPSAAIFSKADLTINGTGKLSVTANYNDGITSKDDLKIMSGTIEIQAKDDGMVGKDLVAVADGNFTVNAGGDGIKATNDEDTSKGFIAIAAGTFDIMAVNDGIQAETSVVIDGGTYTLVTGGGNLKGEVKTGQGQGGIGFGGNRTSESTTVTEETATTETESTSTKGLKARGDITVNGGSFTIDSADDSLHSNSNISITGGEFAVTSGDDGIHADALVSIAGGIIDIKKSYEGIEGANITIAGGETTVVASDDGVNVAGGNDEASTEGAQRQDQFTSSATNLLTISGGYLTVDATGDGLDSNGSIEMSGGNVIVNGPTSSGNGSLDYDGTFELNGGILVAAGSSGMAQSASETSSQFTVSMTFPEVQQAGTMVHLEDSQGNSILTFTPSKNYQTVTISSPSLEKDGSYSLYSGGTSTGSEVDGLYTEGVYAGGTKVVAFEISTSVTYLNESGVTTGGSTMGGPGGGGGGGRGMRPEGGRPEGLPEGEMPEGLPEGEMPDGGMPDGELPVAEDAI